MKGKLRNIQRQRNITGYTFFAPAGIILFCVLFVPLVYSLYMSFQDWNMVYNPEGAKFAGLSNYIEIFNDAYHMHSFKITIYFVLVSVTFEVLLGIVLALLLNGSGRWIRIVRTFVIFPMMISEVVAALCFRYILNADFGLVNYLLGLAGIYIPSWTSESTAFLTIVMIEVWQQTAFAIIIFIAGLQTISNDILDAAKVDGASNLQRLWHITLPAIKPQIMVVLVFRTMFCLRVFTQPWVMTGGGPSNKTLVIGIDIYQQAFRYFEFGKANALAWLLVLLTIAFISVYLLLLGKDDFSE